MLHCVAFAITVFAAFAFAAPLELANRAASPPCDGEIKYHTNDNEVYACVKGWRTEWRIKSSSSVSYNDAWGAGEGACAGQEDPQGCAHSYMAQIWDNSVKDKVAAPW